MQKQIESIHDGADIRREPRQEQQEEGGGVERKTKIQPASRSAAENNIFRKKSKSTPNIVRTETCYRSDLQRCLCRMEYCQVTEQQPLKTDRDKLLKYQYELARNYESTGQVERAGERLEQLIKIQKRLLEPQHPSHSTYQHELA